jgi:hypothetical protein
VWSTLLVAAAAFQLSSRVPRALVLRANFNESSGGEPGFLAALDHRLANLTSTDATLATAVLVFLELLLACGPWIFSRRWALRSTLAVLAAVWVGGENFGGLLTWSASDLGIAPLLALIALGTYDLQDSTVAIVDREVDEPRLANTATPFAGVAAPSLPT